MSAGKWLRCTESDPVTGACTAEAWQDAPALWPYDMYESAQIGFAIILLWAIAWGFRQMKRALDI